MSLDMDRLRDLRNYCASRVDSRCPEHDIPLSQEQLRDVYRLLIDEISRRESPVPQRVRMELDLNTGPAKAEIDALSVRIREAVPAAQDLALYIERAVAAAKKMNAAMLELREVVNEHFD